MLVAIEGLQRRRVLRSFAGLMCVLCVAIFKLCQETLESVVTIVTKGPVIGLEDKV